MARLLSFLIRYFSNYYTLYRSDLAARAVPLDPRLLYIPHKYDMIRLLVPNRALFERFLIGQNKIGSLTFDKYNAWHQNTNSEH